MDLDKRQTSSGLIAQVIAHLGPSRARQIADALRECGIDQYTVSQINSRINKMAAQGRLIRVSPGLYDLP